jgi:hypothetical protein
MHSWIIEYENINTIYLLTFHYQCTLTSRELYSERVIRVLHLHENSVQSALSVYFNFTRTLFRVRYQSTLTLRELCTVQSALSEYFTFTRTLFRARYQGTLTSRELCTVQSALSEYFTFTRTLFRARYQNTLISRELC